MVFSFFLSFFVDDGSGFALGIIARWISEYFCRKKRRGGERRGEEREVNVYEYCIVRYQARSQVSYVEEKFLWDIDTVR